ncbi:MAG: hypothetical protein NUV68_06220 [Caldiserica bacterium]|jgi:hypothetical protein|nr:hypothetical protein [Caldisericota bacterium]MDH7562916.1 PEP/pyruvate-binding domain-containing protein [Caldisericota bacterium]
MPFQVKGLLLIATPYDFFVLEEDGRLSDLFNEAYKQRDLGYIPKIIHAHSLEEAGEIPASDFDMAILALRSFDEETLKSSREFRKINPRSPIVALGFNSQEVFSYLKNRGKGPFDQVFLWQGDGRLVVSIVQLMEDMINGEHDAMIAGIPNVLLVEDSPDFYSSYINLLYRMLWELTSRQLEEKLPFEERMIKQRARPRVHLATTFDEAIDLFRKFQGHFLGVITDGSFPFKEKDDQSAGWELVKYIRSVDPNLPIILQSSESSVSDWAAGLGVDLILKNSPRLEIDLKKALSERFGFGELVLKENGERMLHRIPSVETLLYIVDSLPSDSLYASFKGGDLKRWFLARAEFSVASSLEGPSFQEVQTPDEFRRKLSHLLNSQRMEKQIGKVVPYSRRFKVDQWHFCRMGGGSLGGKARGLVFFDKVLASNFDFSKFPQVKIEIPRTLVLGTDIFEEFLESNKLIPLAYEESSDIRLATAFLNSSLPPTVLGDLRNFIREVKTPLAIRSSSLLEDALYHPFAGIYYTKMIPNSFPELDYRFLSLVNAIKLVYASTFFQNAKTYLKSTNNQIQEEKMAVIIQEVVGEKRDKRFYPDFSGVAKSFNYYPFGGSKPEDGIVNIALGLGKTVVEGEASYSFVPRYPKTPPAYNSIEDLLSRSQRTFYAIDLNPMVSKPFTEEDQYLLKLGLDEAEKDGVLKFLASTYSPGEDRLSPGVSGKGPRVLNFPLILSGTIFPFAETLVSLLQLAEDSLGSPVEMEFACKITGDGTTSLYLGFLQLRPMMGRGEMVEIDPENLNSSRVLCFSRKVLGNGILDDIKDLVLVKRENFDPSLTPQIAREVGIINRELEGEGKPYVLIGPGRWGSADPWLGIPVRWEEISGVKTIVETPFSGIEVEPSQGSHFFHNLSALKIGYFTVSLKKEESWMDFQFLDRASSMKETKYLKHYRFDHPLLIKMDGRKCWGVIFKPEGME